MRRKSRTLIRCQDPRYGGIAIRDGEGCFSGWMWHQNGG